MEDGKICEDLILNSSVPHAIVELTGANAKGTVKQIYNPANVPIQCVKTHVHVILMTIARTQIITNYMKVTQNKITKTRSYAWLYMIFLFVLSKWTMDLSSY